MSFKEAVTTVLTKYCDFNGRARRSEYWYFYLFTLLAECVLGRSKALFGIVFSAGTAKRLAELLLSLYNLALLLPTLGVTVRRLHDTGKSGWYLLWNLLPLVGSIMVLVRLARDGERGTNLYGADPKGVVIYDAPF